VTQDHHRGGSLKTAFAPNRLALLSAAQNGLALAIADYGTVMINVQSTGLGE